MHCRRGTAWGGGGQYPHRHTTPLTRASPKLSSNSSHVRQALTSALAWEPPKTDATRDIGSPGYSAEGTHTRRTTIPETHRTLAKDRSTAWWWVRWLVARSRST